MKHFIFILFLIFSSQVFAGCPSATKMSDEEYERWSKSYNEKFLFHNVWLWPSVHVRELESSISRFPKIKYYELKGEVSSGVFVFSENDDYKKEISRLSSEEYRTGEVDSSCLIRSLEGVTVSAPDGSLNAIMTPQGADDGWHGFLIVPSEGGKEKKLYFRGNAFFDGKHVFYLRFQVVDVLGIPY